MWNHNIKITINAFFLVLLKKMKTIKIPFVAKLKFFLKNVWLCTWIKRRGDYQHYVASKEGVVFITGRGGDKLSKSTGRNSWTLDKLLNFFINTRAGGIRLINQRENVGGGPIAVISSDSETSSDESEPAERSALSEII